jgi:hypothetical protein
MRRPELTSNVTIQALQKELALVEAGLQELRKRYKDKHPAVLRAEEKKAALRQSLETHAKAIPTAAKPPLRVSTSAVIWDGQTLILGPFPSGAAAPEANVILLITPTQVDPAGNRVHARQ